MDLEALLRSRELEHARELAERETKAAAWEQRYKQAIRERELATALAGKPLVPGAASQLVQLWSGEFDVYEENGTTRVTTRDGRSVSRAIADWLSSPEYAHFCQSPSRGGTSPPGANRSAPAIATASRPKTLGDAAIQRWREAATGHGAETSTPIGLHRRR